MPGSSLFFTMGGLSEAAEFADIVVPGTTYLERYDWNTLWVTWPVLCLRQRW